jgi:hypothetical protein
MTLTDRKIVILREPGLVVLLAGREVLAWIFAIAPGVARFFGLWGGRFVLNVCRKKRENSKRFGTTCGSTGMPIFLLLVRLRE